MNGYTPFSIYILFIDSITFIRRQGEGFKLRPPAQCLRIFSQRLMMSDDLYEERLSEGGKV